MARFDDGIAETRLPDGTVTTDVLVVGSGPAGASAALFLATLGIDTIMITKYRWTANTPRAHITNQRAMEIFRDVGIESQVQADATPHELMGDTVFCTSIAGEEIGRILTWGTSPARRADYTLASPCLPVRHPADLPRADPRPQRRDAGRPGTLLDRVPRPRAGRRRCRRPGARPPDRPAVHDPREVPDRCGRRPVGGGERRRAADGGRRWTSPAR